MCARCNGGYNRCDGGYSYDVRYLLSHDLVLSIPAFPNMSNAEYWAVFAMPKNTIHSVALAAADIGKRNWANDMA